MLGNCMPVIENLPPTFDNEMQMMFIRLGFSEIKAKKLVKDQGIDSPQTLASFSDEVVNVICEVLRKPDGFAGE